jgi:molybdate/tungstate transport system substrate-binding protein
LERRKKPAFTGNFPSQTITKKEVCPMKKLVIVIVVLLLFISCGDDKKEEILVLHAGSLSIPFKDMAEGFMKKYPEISVVTEAHGSRTCARQITDLDRRADVMASADSAVIRNLLMPEYAGFCIDFTTNEMVLMYTAKSLFADEIDAKNWYEVLLKNGVEYGHSDPNADPCGYRAVLTMQLAEKRYKAPGLYNKLKEKIPPKNIRPKEVDLIALLEAGELDYIFIYRSVAEQHKAHFVILPDEVNLKSAALAGFYREASIKISGKKPGEWIEKKGAPMVYGITLPKNAKNPRWGARFIAFVLSEAGREIMAKNGQPEIIPPIVDNKDKLPEELKKYFD